LYPCYKHSVFLSLWKFPFICRFSLFLCMTRLLRVGPFFRRPLITSAAVLMRCKGFTLPLSLRPTLFFSLYRVLFFLSFLPSIVSLTPNFTKKKLWRSKCHASAFPLSFCLLKSLFFSRRIRSCRLFLSPLSVVIPPNGDLGGVIFFRVGGFLGSSHDTTEKLIPLTRCTEDPPSPYCRVFPLSPDDRLAFL